MEKIYWSDEVKKGENYSTTTWYRSFEQNKFLRLVEKESEIMGIILDLETNNIGFILKEKKVENGTENK
jgi:hypothetical protein